MSIGKIAYLDYFIIGFVNSFALCNVLVCGSLIIIPKNVFITHIDVFVTPKFDE